MRVHTDPSPAPVFTARETEVLSRICQGLSNQEIAQELYLSINSVKSYVRAAYRKIGLERRSQVIIWALDHGFTPDRSTQPVPNGTTARRGVAAPADFRSAALAPVDISPTQLSTTILTRLGLPNRPEMLSLAERGVATLDAALAEGQPGLLTDFLAHAGERLRVAEVPPVNGTRLAKATHEALATHASPHTLATVELFLQSAFTMVRDGAAARRVAADGPQAPLGLLARRFLDRVLDGEAKAATQVVLDAVRDGMDLGDVLVDVLEAAQHEIGRLWQAGQVTVDQEHFCTAVTQSSMVALYPHLFDGRAIGRSLVAVQAPGSLHQVGLRMVTDLLEHEGWGTAYLGSDVTPEELPDLLVEHRAHVLLLSASMADQAAVVRSMIVAVRADPRTSGVRVAVGGRAFLVAPGLADAVGADGWAPDARSAVTLCNELAGAGDATR
ncbi:hypothetical protein NOCA240022 [metagenome]|uniref:Uncharacterized protein n=1 Tax=metagenome TaxID=256318 RepID=A0A2P2C5H4_9ZZZZ